MRFAYLCLNASKQPESRAPHARGRFHLTDHNGHIISSSSSSLPKNKQTNQKRKRMSHLSELIYSLNLFLTFTGDNSSVEQNLACNGFVRFKDFIASSVCYRNPLKTGRYVGILTTQGPSILSLCEVEVYSRGKLKPHLHYRTKRQGKDINRPG